MSKKAAWSIGAAFVLSIGLAAIIGSVASAAQPANVTLNVVLYPDNQRTELAFSTTDRAPRAGLSGTVRPESGQAFIELEWRDLEPALLFGGEVNCWVLWAITPDGTVQSLGEIPVRTNRVGSARFA